MKKSVWITFALAITLTLVSSVSYAEDKNHVELVKTVIEAFKANDRNAIAKMINYPLVRRKPLPSVKNQSELLSRFDQIFDTTFVNKIVNSDPEKDWSRTGWRGIAFSHGILWLDSDGQIWSVRYESDSENAIRENLINEQKKELHESINSFKKPILEWRTKSFYIRIDDVGDNNYRYASWSINKSTSEKPDLVLLNGQVTFEGSGGNHYYSFKSGDYVYTCDVTVIGSDTSPPGRLVVKKSGKTELNQPVLEILGYK